MIDSLLFRVVWAGVARLCGRGFVAKVSCDCLLLLL